MICKRLVAVILLRNGRAVKSRAFGAYRDVGSPVSQAKILYANGIDEIVVLNTQSEKGIQPLLDVLPGIGERCFIPIAAGGGITSTEQVGQLILAGCEKVVIRTHTELIPTIAKQYGRQAVVECRDYADDELAQSANNQREMAAWAKDEQHVATLHRLSERTLKLAQPTQAGEIMLQCTSRDGTMAGYDDTLVDFDVPVIRLGGCGNYQHMADAFKAGADACAAGSLYAFTDSNPLRAKSFLTNQGILCRGH